MLTEEAKLINERLITVMKPNRIFLFGSYAKNIQHEARKSVFKKAVFKIKKIC